MQNWIRLCLEESLHCLQLFVDFLEHDYYEAPLFIDQASIQLSSSSKEPLLEAAFAFSIYKQLRCIQHQH